jgi:hypothetical protein
VLDVNSGMTEEGVVEQMAIICWVVRVQWDDDKVGEVHGGVVLWCGDDVVGTYDGKAGEARPITS